MLSKMKLSTSCSNYTLKIMNRLALGTVQFGLPYGISNSEGQSSPEEIRKILNLASANNIDTIDTAMSYGRSESFLGSFGMDHFKVITKLPPFPDQDLTLQTWFYKQIDSSLSKLNVLQIYALLLHDSKELLKPFGKDLFKLLQKLKDDGKIHKIGISINSIEELEILVSKFDFDLIQAPFNLIDRRLHNSGWLYKLKDMGIEIHTRSAFLQGLLLMPKEDLPDKFLRWENLWNSWYEWVRESEFSTLSACLFYPLSFSEIDRVIIGVNNEAQLKQVIGSLRIDKIEKFPDLNSQDEDLICPSKWDFL